MRIAAAAVLLLQRRGGGVSLSADSGPRRFHELERAAERPAAADRLGVAVRLALGDLLQHGRDRDVQLVHRRCAAPGSARGGGRAAGAARDAPPGGPCGGRSARRSGGPGSGAGAPGGRGRRRASRSRPWRGRRAARGGRGRRQRRLGAGWAAARAMPTGAATAAATIAAGQSVRNRMLGHVLSPRLDRARLPDALRGSRSIARRRSGAEVPLQRRAAKPSTSHRTCVRPESCDVDHTSCLRATVFQA